ncbi:Clp protease N-terminal domain-containing protein [Actinoplanes solisilvae]|uniref:Clp protease N-terminal domain-containing protein n=1 Tax=Actinoplanes solisilvae TaxID=2486853 RepID=UPI000FDCCF58|nr:Clp protease N-terminal domain-containing protein [Actinoplanes solisilvae]
MTAQVSNGTWSLLREACLVAAEQQQGAIETDLMLIGLANCLPVFRDILGPTPGNVWDPGVRPPWTPSRVGLPPEAELAVSRALRETHWKQFGWAQAGAPAWSEEAVETVRYAMALAVARDAPWMGLDHLLEALLADPATAASHYARRWGVDLDALTEIAERIWPTPGGQPPRRALVRSLSQVGVLTADGEDEERRSAPRKQRLWAGAAKLVMQTGPALGYLEYEATAEAVRSGHDRATPAHLLSAVILFEEELAASDLSPRSEYRVACDAVLLPLGLDPVAARLALAAMTPEGDIASPERRRSWRTNPKNPQWTVAAARAAEAARHLPFPGTAHPAGSAHLLYAVLSDPDDAGCRLLREVSVDPAAVLGVLAHRLGEKPT